MGVDALLTVIEHSCPLTLQACVVQRAQIHAELLGSVYGRGGAHRRHEALSRSGGSLQRLLELWDYHSSLTQQVGSTQH